MFHYLQENRTPSHGVGIWEGKSPLLCMSPAFPLSFYVLNMMPYVQWSIPVLSWFQLSQTGPLSTPTAPVSSLASWDEEQRRPLCIRQCIGPAQEQLKHPRAISMAAAFLCNHAALYFSSFLLSALGLRRWRFFFSLFGEIPSYRVLKHCTAQSGISQYRISVPAEIFMALSTDKFYYSLCFLLHDFRCPKTVENFCVHSRNGYYNGHIIHRIIKVTCNMLIFC